ncbi:hypothetical protein JRQ81_018034 [Phrynocephalus forsythii]|uniref:Uncharacterized protein n=1 Tax=Phrynocephalus forsythii TaxID=171643 RepID=A0A9Q0XUS0_9SAUR|nr:hypothetical protein JRQ81_018034 [Phrynocephalus forsythii]
MDSRRASVAEAEEEEEEEEEEEASVLESAAFRLFLLRQSQVRREGSLAAALAQSMALAVIGTAGAYPSWVLVQDDKDRQVVLGAAWAIARVDPAPGSPLLGPAGAPLMAAIALCCLLSVLSGSLALAMDFLGLRRWRSLAPLLHGLTALLIACAAALGSCLLALSLFLAFLACALASAATGLSCMSPALVQPARSSWDLGRPGSVSPRFFPHGALPAESGTSSEGGSVATVSWQEEIAFTLGGGGRLGKVHWNDKKAAPVDPGAGGRARDEPSSSPRDQLPLPPPEEGEQAPGPHEGKSSVQRFWESGRSLLGHAGKGSQRAGPAAEPPDGGNPEGEQEAETGREAPLESQALSQDSLAST